MTQFQTIGILGAGAWGTALAQAVATAGRDVVMWSYEADVVTQINTNNQNKTYLPEITLNERIGATSEIKDLAHVDVILVVTPAQFTGKTLEGYGDIIPKETPLLICSKGVEIASGRLLSQVLSGLFPDNPIGVLCGPSFAIEVAKGLPTAITLAIPPRHEEMGYALCESLSTPAFRLYLGDDIIGAQIGAAVKNVIAIACGIAAGKEMGDNTRAAIITRGLAEMKRLGRAMGADAPTFSGLSGIGDLVLTCSAMQSRNFSLGFMVGQGKTVEQILQSRNAVSEGVYTAEAVVKLADRMGVDMPICRAVHETLSGRQTIEYAIKGLLERPVSAEG